MSAGSLGSSSALLNRRHTPSPARKWCAGTGWLPESAVLPERRAAPLIADIKNAKDNYYYYYSILEQKQCTLKYWFPLNFTSTASSNFSFKSISQHSLAWWRKLSWWAKTGTETTRTHTHTGRRGSWPNPLKVFESHFIFQVFVRSNLKLWFPFTSEGVPVIKHKKTTKHGPLKPSDILRIAVLNLRWLSLMNELNE